MIILEVIKLASANYSHLTCCTFLIIQDTTEAYLDPSQTSKMEFCEKVDDFKPLTIFPKKSLIVDVDWV